MKRYGQKLRSLNNFGLFLNLHLPLFCRHRNWLRFNLGSSKVHTLLNHFIAPGFIKGQIKVQPLSLDRADLTHNEPKHNG